MFAIRYAASGMMSSGKFETVELAQEAIGYLRNAGITSHVEVVPVPSDAWPEGTKVTVEIDGSDYPVTVRSDNGNGMLYVMHGQGGHEWIHVRNRRADGVLIADTSLHANSNY
jgi:hypothetical protein